MARPRRFKVDPSPITTAAERVLPGEYMMVSPRVSHRRHLLKPCRETNEAFLYLLALWANKYNVIVYAASMMSTYYDLVMRDQDGRHPNFLRDFHRCLVEFLHDKYGIDGNVLVPKSTRVACLAPEAVADQIGYTLANPVTGGGCRFVHEWPGFRTLVGDMGEGVLSARRPDIFQDREDYPPEVTLKLGFPPILEARYGSRQAAQEAVNQAFKKHVKRARAAIKRKGWKYLKGKGRKVDHREQARGWQVFGRIRQRLATLGLSKEEARNAWDKLKKWRRLYHERRLRFLQGERDAPWPFGTWAMVHNFGMDAEAPLCPG